MRELLRTLRDGVTVRGMRSTFADWAAKNKFSFELRELALAHAVGDTTSRAYNRDNLVELRRPMMTRWAKHCAG
jgi:integrase